MQLWYVTDGERKLCVTLKEECGVYVDHLGLIKDSMAKVQEGLEKKKTLKGSRTKLVSKLLFHFPLDHNIAPAILGPLVGLLPLVSFWPWAFRKLTLLWRNKLMIYRKNPYRFTTTTWPGGPRLLRESSATAVTFVFLRSTGPGSPILKGRPWDEYAAPLGLLNENFCWPFPVGFGSSNAPGKLPI